jgi:predicted nucleic acid-binding protein
MEQNLAKARELANKFLIDTNVVIDVLGHSMPDAIKKKVLQMPLIVSAVTYMETLGWYHATPSELSVLRSFLDAATILPISQSIMDKTVLVRQQKRIGLGDAIIAATALVHRMTVVTRNISDFRLLDDLIVLNPWE